MPSNDEAARDYGGVSLDDPEIVFVHLLLYGHDMEVPSLADAREWAEHYGIAERPNHVVLVGDGRMLGRETRAMIPGLQLIDRDFVLRYDSTGQTPEHDMWTELWPAVAGFLTES